MSPKKFDILSWFRWRLPQSLEIEFQDTTLKAAEATLKLTTTLVMILLTLAMMNAMAIVEPQKRFLVFVTCSFFQVTILAGVYFAKLKGRKRHLIAYLVPVFIIIGVYLWMTHYVANLSDLKKYHTNGFATVIIFGAYALEKQNPRVALFGGLGATFVYLIQRYQLGLLGSEIFLQIITGTLITNVLGYYVCLTSAKSDRKQFVLAKELESERILSDQLVLKILPAAIAPHLRSGQTINAESHSSVSILFADLVGFTALASRVSPNQLISILNEIFSSFDRLGETFGIEKIKTIGDGYMAVAGCPKPMNDHAARIAAFALAIRDALKVFNAANKMNLNLRIGIHSGQVIAGVIGEKRFGYDIWGDAVNIASRMESTAEPGEIQVSYATAELIKENFIISDLHPVQIKGKGEIMTCLLQSAHPERAFKLSEQDRAAA